mgnify:CR=1 FL=1
MAIKITDECINCGACEPECPNNAIYESGVGWKYSDGTSLTEVEERNGKSIDPNIENPPKEEEFFYIAVNIPQRSTFLIVKGKAGIQMIGHHPSTNRRGNRVHGHFLSVCCTV